MSCRLVHRSLRLHLAIPKHFPDQIGSHPKTALSLPERLPSYNHQTRLASTEESDKEKKKCPTKKFASSVLDIKSCDSVKPEMTDKLHPDWDQPRVVIIGAGMAGLSAAEHLLKYGFKCVTILEAKDRPGGRIWTCGMDKAVVEVGAQKILGGTIVNPMVPLIARDATSSQNYRKHCNQDAMIFLNECGNVIRTSIVNKVRQIFTEMVEKAKNIYRNPINEEYSSLNEFFNNYLDNEIPSKFKLMERSDAIKVVNALIVDLENEWGTAVTNISANYFGSRVDVPGCALTFDKGLSNALKPMMSKMEKCCLIMDKPVKIVKWASPVGCPRATLVCCDGDEVQADYVIVTVSLGVLKSQATTLFCPQLPCEKIEIIDRIGFGHINKVFLQYEKPFWVNREAYIKPAITCDESDWIESVGVIEEAPIPNSNVLIAKIGGTAAREVEKIPDCQVVCLLQRLIRCVVGNPTLPYPKHVMRSKWSSDGHFCGATTYMSADSNIGDIVALSDPVPLSSPSGAPVLFFAGEATSPTYYGTIHGARQSGIREADRIVHLTKLFCGIPPKMENEACRI